MASYKAYEPTLIVWLSFWISLVLFVQVDLDVYYNALLRKNGLLETIPQSVYEVICDPRFSVLIPFLLRFMSCPVYLYIVSPSQSGGVDLLRSALAILRNNPILQIRLPYTTSLGGIWGPFSWSERLAFQLGMDLLIKKSLTALMLSLRLVVIDSRQIATEI